MEKVVKTLEEAIRLCGLQSGMTISFHHNLRSGDTIAKEIVKTISRMGIRQIRLAPTSLYDGHDALAPFIEDKTINRIDSSGYSPVLGALAQRGKLDEISLLRTHGGRARAIESGAMMIDVAFIAASCCDKRGNCNSVAGKSAFGSMGYSMMDARYAKKVIVITDMLSELPAYPFSIDESMVDYVVAVESIGNPQGIVSRTTKITSDPVSLIIAKTTADVVNHSGYLKDGICMQMGAGSISLAAAAYLEKIMAERKITGEFGLGGITGAMVDMLEKGLFQALYDVQCFDTVAVSSLAKNKNHMEVSASMYANPDAKDCLVRDLDCVILGATEIDTDFNVNVYTDSNNHLISGAGGHGDTAEGAKMTVITAPSFRARTPIIVDRVNTVSTPGKYVDVYVSERGVAVNTSLPKNKELAYRLKEAGLPIRDIHDLKTNTEKFTGKPEKVKKGEKTIAKILWRDDTVIDEIKSTAE